MRDVPSKIEIVSDPYVASIQSRIDYADDICGQLRRQDALAAITITAIQSGRERLNKEAASKEGRQLKDKEGEAPLSGHAFLIRQFRVVFLEPYPKSYAKELHSDSIEIEGRDDVSKVKFMPFMGISPFRYRDFFEKGKRKDGEGNVIRWKDGVGTPIVEIYHPVYITLETMVASKLKDDLKQVLTNH